MPCGIIVQFLLMDFGYLHLCSYSVPVKHIMVSCGIPHNCDPSHMRFKSTRRLAIVGNYAAEFPAIAVCQPLACRVLQLVSRACMLHIVLTVSLQRTAHNACMLGNMLWSIELGCVNYYYIWAIWSVSTPGQSLMSVIVPCLAIVLGNGCVV